MDFFDENFLVHILAQYVHTYEAYHKIEMLNHTTQTQSDDTVLSKCPNCVYQTKYKLLYRAICKRDRFWYKRTVLRQLFQVRPFVMEACRWDKHNLFSLLPDVFKKDREIAMASIKRHSSIYLDLDDSLKGDYDVCMATVSRSGWLIRYMPPHILKSREIVRSAVDENGWVLNNNLPTFIYDDKTIVQSAIKYDPLLIQLASERLRDDLDIAILAVQYHHTTVKYLSERLQQDPRVREAALMSLTRR